MRKLRNKKPVGIGDLVKCIHCDAPEYGKMGLVTDRIHYVKHKAYSTHPDEYSCVVLFSEGERVLRAKWLQVLSKKGEKLDV